MPKITITTLANAADWHAHHALKAYRKREYDAYTRHIREADILRADAQILRGVLGR